MTQKTIIVAVDGPSGSGKGTLARALAAEFGLAFLDTGSLYRRVALGVLDSGGDPESEADCLRVARAFQKDPQDMMMSVSDALLRSEDVSRAASQVSAIPSVRAALLAFQQDFARNPPAFPDGTASAGAVLDGRDIATVVCPDADVKLFLTADPEIRAERRYKELQSKGIDVTYEAVLTDIRRRDERDSSRSHAPLVSAPDAVVLDSSRMNAEAVRDEAIRTVRGVLGCTGRSSVSEASAGPVRT